MHFDVHSQRKATQVNMGIIVVQLFIFLLTSRFSKSDWVSEWMSPIEDQLGVAQRFNGDSMMVHITQDEENSRQTTPEPQVSNQMSAINLKIKLDQTMRTAKVLAQTLKAQIRDLIVRETTLKEAIANGRFGVSILTVSKMNQVPRSYIIRDGRWSTCNGMIQYPVASQTSGTNLFNGLFSGPRCIGKEMVSLPDPCVFNSVIKYDVIPMTRAPEYTEEEYLCLKPNFNITLERYMSVTRQTINETCENGAVRSLADNTLECGVRILSEYSFYPYRSSAASTLPLEYCIENDGSCKLIVAWHVSNATIENFEFLKNEHNFKKYFIKSGPYLEHVI